MRIRFSRDLIYILLYIFYFSFFFQLPEFLTQVKEALGLPSVPTPVAASGASAAPPPIPAPAAASGPPPIVLEDSDSDNAVQTLSVPFRSGSLEAYLPMVSTDDSWSSDTEFR